MENRRHNRSHTALGWIGDQSTSRLYFMNKPWTSVWGPIKLLNATLRSFGVVAFANSLTSGVIILLAMFAGNINVAIAGLLSGVIGVPLSKFLRASDEAVCDGVTLFNGVLAVCVGSAVVPSVLNINVDVCFWLWLVALIIVTCVVDQALNVLMQPVGLPAQSIAFNIVLAVAMLALRGRLYGTDLLNTKQSINATDTFVTPQIIHNFTDIEWNRVFEGSLLAAGQVYGVGTMTSSILIWIAFFVYSPILTCCFYIGSVTGTFLGLLLGPASEVYIGLWSYNSLLTAGGLCYFLQPSLMLLPTVLVGSIMAVVIQAALVPIFQLTQVPVFSYPFNIAINLLLPIGTQPGRCIKFLKHRSYPEMHVYQYYTKGKVVDQISDEELPLPAESKC